MNSDPFLCVRCAAHQKTCCQTSEVAVTLGDVRRIAEHTGESDFFEFLEPTDPVYLEQSDDPLWLETVIQPDGTRRVLRRRDNGDCRFLAENGCTLPIEVRPLICRIYPYDYNEQGLHQRLARGCPLELLRPNESLLAALDVDRQQAEAWHKQLYSEIRNEPHFAMKQFS